MKNSEEFWGKIKCKPFGYCNFNEEERLIINKFLDFIPNFFMVRGFTESDIDFILIDEKQIGILEAPIIYVTCYMPNQIMESYQIRVHQKIEYILNEISYSKRLSDFFLLNLDFLTGRNAYSFEALCQEIDSLIIPQE